MSPDDLATAEGSLQRTPVPHLLVYMADRRLSGALFLKEPSGVEHTVRFEWGAPVRVESADRYALFGEMLVEAGVVSEDVVRGALATKGLLGDVLILTGHADADTLERIAADQLTRRLVRLFGLPGDTVYQYFDGHAALRDAAVPGCRGEVLRLLVAGLRAHPRSGLSISKLLEHFGDTKLRLHPDAVLERFGFDDAEACVATAVLMDRPTLVDLLSASVAEVSVVRRVVYTLLLTRQLDLGQKLPPLGVEETPPLVTLGRLHLSSAVHRIGAAAPDPAGDGVRAAVMPRTLRRRKGGAEAAPNMAIDGEEEPVSDVVEIVPTPDAGSPRGS
jgi:hypothetical protein